MIPFEDLGRANGPFEASFRRALDDILSTGRYVLGEHVERFEEEFARHLGVGHAVGVGSGSDAITMAFMSLGITRGEVIVPDNGCPATALAVVRAGLIPVMSDPDPGTFLMDPEDVERRVTPRTVAILPVHLFGLACDMEAILPVADRNGLRVVEDCAQAHGALFHGRPAGSFGDAAAFSFYPTKNLGGLGDGGMVVTRDARAARAVRTLRNYGLRDGGRAEVAGWNSRLDELQAAFLLEKLPRLGDINARKNELAARYDAGLSPAFRRPVPVRGSRPARHLYPVLHPRRDELRRYLAEAGIGTSIHYSVPSHRQAAFSGCAHGEYPASTAICRSTLSLPLSFGHTVGEIDAVIAAMNRFPAV